MTDFDIIIVGAGAAGLMAARELSRSGRSVAILEANNRIGGRIHTLSSNSFSIPIETGAEFIHGELPLTLKILNEAGIPLVEMEGETYQVKDGSLQQNDNYIEGLPVILAKMKELQQDMPLKTFFDEYFSDVKYEATKKSLRRMVEGYDAADIRKVSTFSIREELSEGGMNKTIRPAGGYGKMIDFMAEDCGKSGCQIFLSSIVKDIFWKEGRVEVRCANGEHYTSRKLLLTVSLGVLKCDDNREAYIRFIPELPGKRSAIKSMEFGTVIKIFMEFREAFWENKKYNVRQMPGLDFLISDTPPITAWWTQLPDKTPLITGWMAGPNAEKIQSLDDDAIFEKTISLLADLFKTDKSFITGQLKAQKVVNWYTDPYSCGAYAYVSTQSSKARKILAEPVENTLFFAGEALYDGSAIGTVEAALASALNSGVDK
ncbi:MAG: NAD(P)/FAD-dependent oxidoreductase [Ignavibacteriaceae bacterium]